MSKLIKFMLVGGSGALLALVLMFAFTDTLRIYYAISYALTFAIVVVYNYILNSRWTFQEYKSQGFLVFLAGRGITLCINEFILFILTRYLELHYLVATIIAIIVSFSINYFFNRRYTWVKQIES